MKKVNYIFLEMSFTIEEKKSCILWYTEPEMKALGSVGEDLE